MAFETLIGTEALAPYLNNPDWALVDCRFDLARTEWGEAQYQAGHIPGAVYAHLNRDLSGAKTGLNGRHPLPAVEAFARRAGEWGIGPGVQVVAYDQDHGMYASRLWWLLRYVGHTAVAVLDGGLARWQREGRDLRGGVEQRRPRPFSAAPRRAMAVTVDQVERLRLDPGWRLIDARSPVRFRGETEPLDPVAGHIPGAVNFPNVEGVSADGIFLPREALRARLLELLGLVPAERAVCYCGSGVAACQDILALEHAGLSGAKLYAGSWSEWCADPARPVATG